jgi:glycosyltransferase involved in cell wall biosynthesis
MPVYNGEKYLCPAIESILGQTFTDFDFLIVDDGSTDQTPGILDSYDDRRIRVISQDNQGLGVALNRGIRASLAKYIARMDADDIAATGRLKKQVEYLDQNPEYVIVGGCLEFITADGQPIYVQTVLTSSDEIKQSIGDGGNPFLHPSVMFRKRSALECGLYNEDLRCHQDRDFYKRLAATGRMANLPVCLGKYRIVPGALSNQQRKTLRKRTEIVRKAEQGGLTDKERQFLKDATLKRDIRIDNSVYALRVGKAYLQHANDARAARRYLWRAVRTWVFNWPAWYNLVLGYLPFRLRFVLERLR